MPRLADSTRTLSRTRGGQSIGAPYRLTQVRLYNAPPCAHAATIRVLLSQDDRNWTEVYSNAGRLFEAAQRVVNLNENRNRYVRVDLSDRTWLHRDEVGCRLIDMTGHKGRPRVRWQIEEFDKARGLLVDALHALPAIG